MARPDERPPSLAMVAAGGFGVLAVLIFVAAVAFGARAVGPTPGDRLAVGRDDSGVVIAVGRCPVERVTSVAVAVAVADGDGATRWQITSPKGSIDERYAVGAPAPTGFGTDVELEGRIGEEPVEVRVTIDRDGTEIVDRVRVRTAELDDRALLHQGVLVTEETFEGRAVAAAGCPGGGSERGVVVWLFGAAAIVVVVAFAGMVRRWWVGRRP